MVRQELKYTLIKSSGCWRTTLKQIMKLINSVTFLLLKGAFEIMIVQV